MIRYVSTVSLLVLLMLTLYLPSAFPPERFIAQVRIEHQLNAAIMGESHATHILARMLDFQETANHTSPVPSLSDAPKPNRVDNAVADQMSQVNQRLFNNPYFRSIDTLLTLASYRLSVIIEWWIVFPVFLVAVFGDGLLVRIIKSREFIQHSPQVYALYACAAITTSCVSFIAFVLPITIPPFLLPLIPVVICTFLSRAASNFQRRA